MIHISIKSPAVLVLAFAFAAAVVGTVLLSADWTGSTSAEKYFVQSAVGEAHQSRSVSAEFRRQPSEGDLLVAIVSNSIPSVFNVHDGWNIALNESGSDPGQTILYRFARANEASTMTIHGFEQYTDLALQVFEYRGLDVNEPPALVRSARGFGDTIELQDISSGTESAISILAATTKGREFFRHWHPETFQPRREVMTRGSGAISASAGELALLPNDRTNLESTIASPSQWIVQAVVFSVASDLQSAALEDEDNPAEYLSLEVEVDNDRPKEASDITYSITVKNDGEESVTNLEIATLLPTSVDLKSANVEKGLYKPFSHVWFLDELGSGESATLDITTTVKRDTARSSFLFKPSVFYFDQYIEGEVDIWDAASVEVAKLTFDEEFALEDCKEVDFASVAINEGASTTDSPEVTISANAQNATYALMNTRPDITSAIIYPVGQDIPFVFDETLGEKTIYAWLGNSCDRSRIIETSIELVDPQEEEEEEVQEEEVIVQEEEQALQQEEEAPPQEETQEEEAAADETTSEDEEAEQSSQPEETQQAKIPAGCAPSVPFVSYLYSGSTGSEVERLQSVLACLGYYSGPVDGIFDQEVTTAVANVQSAYGLTASGAMNLLTRELLSGY